MYSARVDAYRCRVEPYTCKIDSYSCKADSYSHRHGPGCERVGGERAHGRLGAFVHCHSSIAVEPPRVHSRAVHRRVGLLLAKHSQRTGRSATAALPASTNGSFTATISTPGCAMAARSTSRPAGQARGVAGTCCAAGQALGTGWGGMA